MAHTPFEGMNNAVKVLGEGGAYSALKNIEDALKRLQTASIEGIPLLAIGKNENIFHDDLGNILIEVGLLKEQIQLGTMYLRDNGEGAFEQSVDGITWEALLVENDLPGRTTIPMSMDFSVSAAKCWHAVLAHTDSGTHANLPPSSSFPSMTDANVWAYDEHGYGIEVRTQGNGFNNGISGGTTISNAASPSPFDYVHVRPTELGYWIVLDSRGNWVIT